MKKLKLVLVICVSLLLSNISFAKDPSELINGIVNEASLILKSSDPVQSKIIKLEKCFNSIHEKKFDKSKMDKWYYSFNTKKSKWENSYISRVCTFI